MLRKVNPGKKWSKKGLNLENVSGKSLLIRG